MQAKCTQMRPHIIYDFVWDQKKLGLALRSGSCEVVPGEGRRREFCARIMADPLDMISRVKGREICKTLIDTWRGVHSLVPAKMV